MTVSIQPKIQSRRLPNTNEKSEKSGPGKGLESALLEETKGSAGAQLWFQPGLVVRAPVCLVHLTEGRWGYSPSVFWERSIVSLHWRAQLLCLLLLWRGSQNLWLQRRVYWGKEWVRCATWPSKGELNWLVEEGQDEKISSQGKWELGRSSDTGTAGTCGRSSVDSGAYPAVSPREVDSPPSSEVSALGPLILWWSSQNLPGTLVRVHWGWDWNKALDRDGGAAWPPRRNGLVSSSGPGKGKLFPRMLRAWLDARLLCPARTSGGSSVVPVSERQKVAGISCCQ
jgi:hypothetical protein